MSISHLSPPRLFCVCAVCCLGRAGQAGEGHGHVLLRGVEQVAAPALHQGAEPSLSVPLLSPSPLPPLSLSRYTKASLYQGEWTGVPLFTPLKPHGEGVAVFFDGWGFCREAKMLQVRVFGNVLKSVWGRFGVMAGSFLCVCAAGWGVDIVVLLLTSPPTPPLPPPPGNAADDLPRGVLAGHVHRRLLVRPLRHRVLQQQDLPHPHQGAICRALSRPLPHRAPSPPPP